MELRTLLLAGVTAGSLSLSGYASAAAVLSIDEFNDAAQAITLVGPVVPQTVTLTDNETSEGLGNGAFGSGIIGGWRDLSTTLISAPGGLGTNAQVLTAGDGMFVHSQDVFVTSTTTLTWDGFAGAGLNQDVTAYDRIDLFVLFADADVEWELELTDTLLNSFAATVSTPLGITDTLISINLAPYCAAIDCSDIFSIRFTANNQEIANLDTAIDWVRFVDTPEPGTLALLGAGLLGFGLYRRRRN